MKAQNRKEIFLKALANGEEPKIKPLTREEALLKKQAKRESESSGGGVSDIDWNIMKNKPFGEETGITTLFPEQELEIAGCDYKWVQFSVALILGETYTVIVNGEAHEIECTYDDTYRPQHQLIVNDDLLIYTEEDDYGLYFSNNLSDMVTITVSIEGPGTVIKTIDEKYLPQSGGGSFVVNLTQDEENCTVDQNIDDILNAIESGQNVIMVQDMGEGMIFSVYHLEDYAIGGYAGKYAIFSNVGATDSAIMVNRYQISEYEVADHSKSFSMN